MNKEEIEERASKIQWFHKYEIIPGVMSPGPGLITEAERAKYFQIPEDLSGKRVLDIGCADGFFTFLAESRGASVVAIDAWPHAGFALAHEARQSQAEFYQVDLYDLQPDTFGAFDIVFFMGVYYHLKNPILALERIANVTRELAIIESQIMNLAGFEDEPVSRFLEHDELVDDPTNWWVPNVPCLLRTVRAAGFPRAELVTCYSNNSRGVVHAYKGPRTAGKMLTEDFICGIHTPTRTQAVSGVVEITGVAFSKLNPEEGVDRVTVYLDQLDEPTAELGRATYGWWHPEVAARVGERYGAVGFEFNWDTTGVAPGPHTLYVLAEGKRGWHYARQPIVVGDDREVVPEPPQQVESSGDLPVDSLTLDNLPVSLPGKLSELDRLNERINVSFSPARGGSLINKARRAFHHLVIYYVNMLAKRQRVFNQTVILTLKQLTTALEKTEANLETRQKETMALRAEVQALAPESDQQVQ